MGNDPGLPSNPTPLFWALLVLTLLTAFGSLFLTLGMQLVACTLCFYQRTFILALSAILIVGVTLGLHRQGVLSVLALPLVSAGLCVAVFHHWLEYRRVLECPAGLFGLGTAPMQSLVCFGLLTLGFAADVFLGARSPNLAMTVILALGLGLGAGVLSIISGPKLEIPKQPYDKPLNGCRPRYFLPTQ